MKARPILMHGRSVRNLLAGRKTQTRRIVKPQPRRGRYGDGSLIGELDGQIGRDGYWVWTPEQGNQRGSDIPLHEDCMYRIQRASPYGQPGDLIYVREEFSGPYVMSAHDELPAVPPSKWPPETEILYWADGEPEWGDWTKPKPSIHLPRRFSRITLRLTDVRVERVQEITDHDALAEGIVAQWRDVDGNLLYGHRESIGFGSPEQACNPSDAFRGLWNDTNGAGAWDRNDWVWALTFDVIHANVDEVLAEREK